MDQKSKNNSVIELTKALVSIPSITPEDKGCLDIVAPYLKQLGFKIEFFPCQNANNLWARYGDQEPLFCFAGHTDVVVTGPLEKWKFHPFTPTEEGGWLYGRGVADMKSGIAAFMTAVQHFLKRHPRFSGSLAMLITSAEEGPSYLGTPVVIDALEKRKEKIKYCLVGEPSSQTHLGDTIKIGRRGSLNGSLSIYGKQGHIAYPHLADNPIHRMALPLTELMDTRWDEGDLYFQPTELQFSNIRAGAGANNVIPEALSAHFNFRFSPAVTAQQLQDRFDQILKRHVEHYSLSWDHSGNPFLTSKGNLLKVACQLIKEEFGIDPELSTKGGTSDGRFIAPTGAEVIELGLSNQSIHEINERASVKDIIQLSLLYEKLLERIFI